MTKIPIKRKTRSDKFPLTLHKTGQFCKKIRGKLHYFGNDKKKAMERYLERAAYLHTGKVNKSDSPLQTMTLKTLCNLYLDYQNSRVQAEEISVRHYADEVDSLKKLARFLGSNLCVSEITALDLQNYKRNLNKSYSQNRINLNLAIMKAMFHWAKKNDVLNAIPNIDAVSKVKLIRKEKQTFTIEQIKKLIENADLQMRAMILLGLNCGFGCTDCAELQWSNLDLNHSRVDFPRRKTGISRNLLLWPETVEALTKLTNSRELVFYTAFGNPWVRTIKKKDENGTEKYIHDDAISKKFCKLLKQAGIAVVKGVGFYTLRRTAATLAARSRDPFAVQKLLGHADLKMASVYVQDVSEQTDRAINNTRNLLIQ